MITTKINGVAVTTTPNQTVAKTSAVSIGEVCDAIQVIVNASKIMGAKSLGRIVTDELYGSHDAAYIAMLEIAGERAKTLQQDAYAKANADSIVSCGPELSRR
tara:strand:- start:2436 stop:2744 length:309 start_codon:yes stop_codon:yes gene_type:complete